MPQTLFRRAEQALFQRTALACSAAGGVGRFCLDESEGVLSVRAEDPALGFLSSVSGATPANLAHAIERARAARSVLLVSEELATSPDIRAAGLTRVDDRLLALKQLATAEPRARAVVEASDRDRFVRLLLAGYDAAGTVAEFIEAEHRSPRVRAFFAMADGSPVAAAAMTVHGDVAVLGGASTLPTHRRQGAQTDLIRHRLHKAAEAGATLAVATARPASASAANLARAGFRLMRRVAFSAV